MPLVSVVMCTYKRAHLLPRSVRSVIQQDWRPLELVLTNDGSPDDTVRVMEELAQECRAANVIANFATQENGGVARARNAGLRRLTGEFVSFLDDDDTWLPHKTSRQMAEIEKTGADACSALVAEDREEGSRPIPSTPDKLFTGHNPGAYMRAESDCHINALLVKKPVADRVGEFDPSVKSVDDTEWKMRLVHEATFCAVPEVLARYSVTPGAISRYKGYKGLITRDGYHEFALLRMRESCKGRRGFDDKLWLQVAAKAYDTYAKHRLYGGEIEKARELWQRGMEITGGLEPLPRLKPKFLKARLLALFGKRLRHPKLANIEDFSA